MVREVLPPRQCAADSSRSGHGGNARSLIGHGDLLHRFGSEPLAGRAGRHRPEGSRRHGARPVRL